MTDKKACLLLILICTAGVGLEQIGEQMQNWHPRATSEMSMEDSEGSATRVALTLAAQNGVRLERVNGIDGEIHSSDAVSITQVNRWLEQLAVKRIAPTTLWLRTASGEGNVIIEKTGFES